MPCALPKPGPPTVGSRQRSVRTRNGGNNCSPLSWWGLVVRTLCGSGTLQAAPDNSGLTGAAILTWFVPLSLHMGALELRGAALSQLASQQ